MTESGHICKDGWKAGIREDECHECGNQRV